MSVYSPSEPALSTENRPNMQFVAEKLYVKKLLKIDPSLTSEKLQYAEENVAPHDIYAKDKNIQGGKHMITCLSMISFS